MKIVLIVGAMILLAVGMGWLVIHHQGSTTLIEVRQDRFEQDSSKAVENVRDTADQTFDRMGSALGPREPASRPVPVEAR